MNVNERIRIMREINKWSQEDMAEKLNMSPNGYAKIERGETKINLEKLEQIAKIFNIDAIELMDLSNRGSLFLMSKNYGYNSTNYYSSNDKLCSEIEKLNLIIEHQKELLNQKDTELEALRRIINLLESKLS